MRTNPVTMPISIRRKSAQRGTTIIEFVLVTALVLVPLLLGLLVVGFNIIRDLQAHQIARDAGHMFARGVDFSTATGTGNRDVITYMAPRLADSSSSGTGVLVMSSVEYIGATTCTGCPNVNHVVFTRQVNIGNTALFSSKFGTAPAASLYADGSAKNPLTDTSLQCDRVLSVLNVDGYTMNDGQLAYITEAYYTSTDFDLSNFLSPSSIYARSIF